MALINTEQAEIEKTISKALRDVSRANPFHLKAGLRILMTANLQAFESVCSSAVQQDLQDFKELLLHPEHLAPQSTKTIADRTMTLNFIKHYTLDHLTLLDNRTAILPNTYMVQKSIMEGERLKSVVHSSALRNIVFSAHYFDSLETKFKKEGMPPEKIPEQIQKAAESTRQLHQFALAGHISGILKCLSVHGVDVNFPNEQGMTPLHLATRKGFVETVKLLLTVPGINANLPNNNGWTPLHFAARLGFADIADALLTMPTLDVNIVSSDGWSALHWAAWHGFTEVVTVLLTAPHIVVNLANRTGTTPLQLAARNGHPDVIAILLSVPSILVNFKDNEHSTALHMAVRYNHEAAVKTLLSYPNIALNDVDLDGFTPLHWAARNGNASIVKDLLAEKDLLTEELDNNGMTPYDWALRNEHKEVLMLLHPYTAIRTKSWLSSFFQTIASFFKKKTVLY